MKFKSQQPASFHGPKCGSKGMSRRYRNDECSNLEHELSKKVPSILFKRSYTGKTGYVECVEIQEKKQRNHQAIACPGRVLIEKRKQDPVYRRSSGYTDVNGTKGRTFIACTRPESSDESSVGSCSLNSWRQDEFFESDLLSSDAASVYPSYDKEEEEEDEEMEDRNDCFKQKVEVSVHSLELHAYRCTLEALFVSGPLSWEQEELLTNLRITLHISNDEHLKLLRDLISSATSK